MALIATGSGPKKLVKLLATNKIRSPPFSGLIPCEKVNETVNNRINKVDEKRMPVLNFFLNNDLIMSIKNKNCE